MLQEGEKSFFQVYRAVFEQLVADERDAKSRRQAMREQMPGDEFEYVSSIRQALSPHINPTKSPHNQTSQAHTPPVHTHHHITTSHTLHYTAAH